MNGTSGSRLLIIAGVFVVFLALAWQQRSIGKLHSELESLRAQSAEEPTQAERPSSRTVLPQTRIRPSVSAPAQESVRTDTGLQERVVVLEDSVHVLMASADYLMNRGEVPPSAAKAAELRATFFDLSKSERDRLAALRLLQRNNLMDDAVVVSASQFLANAQDANVQRSLLGYLRGVEDESLKGITLALATSSEEGRVREAALSNLRNYVNDPQVEATLWQMATTDSSSNVRRRAEEALRRADLSEQQLASVRNRASGSGASLDEQLMAVRVLSEKRQDISDIAPALSQSAQGVADPEALLKYYGSFDDVNHPEFMLPLVQGVQHENVEVRLRATDALIDYRTDPTIMEWLTVLAESDPDPRVRREAARAFQSGRASGRR